MTQFDVVGFGALNLDRIFQVNRIAAKEEESFVKDYEETCGGSAANTIVGLARLGCKVGFIGKVGSDRGGKTLVNDFKRMHVDINCVSKAKNGLSGQVMGFVDPDGQRALYIASGVNDSIRLGEQVVNYAASTEFLHLTSFVGAKSFQAQVQLMKRLPESVKLTLDPGSLYARRGLEELEPLIRKAYAVMPNAGELELLTGREGFCEGAECLLEKGVKIVAVKLGEKGCYVTDGRETEIVPALKVKVVDTTGAGDAFNAGFLFGLLKQKSLAHSGRIGNFVASRCVMKIGARVGLPTAKDLAFLF